MTMTSQIKMMREMMEKITFENIHSYSRCTDHDKIITP